MWIFTESGFYSIVQKPEDVLTGTLTVRARSLEDMQNLCHQMGMSESRIQHNTGTDYPYRVRVPRSVFRSWLSAQGDLIDYPNFKDRVHFTTNGGRAVLYARVWNIMRQITDSKII
jgi:hypothetical protein